MKYKNKILSLILGLSVAGTAWSQKNISTQNHGWYMYFGNHKITDKLSLHTEYQWRRDDIIKNWQQSLSRIGIDYKLAPNVMVTGGYGYIVSFPYGDQPIAFKFHEHRIWQQLVLNHLAGRFYFNHRYRLEQRFLENRIDNGDGTSSKNGYTFKERARYRFMVSVPLNKKVMEKGALFVSVYDEPFIQFGPNFARNYLDQNRLYAALGYMFLPNANMQFGYLNQFAVKSSGLDAENNHTLQLSLTYNLDFRKKKE